MIVIGLVLLVCAIGIPVFAWDVIRGFRTDRIEAMYGYYDRSDSPVQFWICMMLYFAATIVSLFVAVIVLLVFAGVVD